MASRLLSSCIPPQHPVHLICRGRWVMATNMSRAWRAARIRRAAETHWPEAGQGRPSITHHWPNSYKSPAEAAARRMALWKARCKVFTIATARRSLWLLGFMELWHGSTWMHTWRSLAGGCTCMTRPVSLTEIGQTFPNSITTFYCLPST